MAKSYYIASCVFSLNFPELSAQIQEYIKRRFDDITIIRCCIPGYKVMEYEENIPASINAEWRALNHCAEFMPGDTVYSICHNCSNIIEETNPGVNVKSLWELILSDKSFPYPDHSGMSAVIQDCWRSKERSDEQNAVRELLGKMNIAFLETSPNLQDTDFCGTSLYRAQPSRNPAIAPRHYRDNIDGKFIPHTEEEQKAIMQSYCSRFEGKTAVCYCHYCLEGLLVGDADAKHIAQLLF